MNDTKGAGGLPKPAEDTDAGGQESKEPVMNPHEAITTGLAEARREHVKVPMEKRMPRAANTPGSRMEPHSRGSK